ncbi:MULTISPECIES: DUF4232 domain-containing protein [unclassified Streptomyces]|uniref:DUF4232 domain-containing protein n=1 Tax=unclassified Streptomyces TaxID=2593676 RepID=UPI0038165876
MITQRCAAAPGHGGALPPGLLPGTAHVCPACLLPPAWPSQPQACAAPSPRDCKTNAAPDKDSGRIDITMINRGSTTCSATGFAGVDIKDDDNTSNPIARAHAQPRITTLKPGDAAVFNLAYDIDNTGDSLASPTDILVTPPNETHTVSLKWPAGAGEIKGAYTEVEVYPTHSTDWGWCARLAPVATG